LNIKVDRQEFLKTLRVVEKAIAENKIRPIISCVYLEAQEDGKIVLRGTNLELTITSFMEGEVQEKGKAVFSYQLVEEYLKEITDKEINLVVKEGLLIIETSDSSSEFSVMEPEEYPRIKDSIEGAGIVFSREKLSEMLEKTKFGASTSIDNLSINCVRIEIEDKKVKVVATDTYRLVYLEDDIEYDGSLKVSIPLTTVDALIKTLRTLDEENVEFKFEENQVFFKVGNSMVLSRVIDLPFPDYNGIMKSVSHNKKISANTEEFSKILKRVQIFVKNNSESKYSAIFSLEAGSFYVSGVSETAKVNEHIEVEQEGEDVKISLNVKFLLDFIQHLDKNDRLIIDLLTSNSAIQLKNSKDEKYLYIAMPLALRD